MSKITILGTGNMGRAIAIRLLAGGNTVTLLSRTPDRKATLFQELTPHAKKGASVKVEKLGTPFPTRSSLTPSGTTRPWTSSARTASSSNPRCW